jgi:hypothetical protein
MQERDLDRFIDLMSPTQAAVFRALEAGVTLAPVYDHVKPGTEPNFVKIGAINGTNEGAREEQREEFEVEVHSIYRGADRTELIAIMHQVRQSLDGVAIAADGVSFWTPEFLAQAISDAGPDGVTYAGISTFLVSAEPA